MRQDDVEKAGSTYQNLFTLSAASMEREAFRVLVEERIRKAGILAPDGTEEDA